MNQENLFYTAIGKRKTSVAKVFLKEGTGIITVNQKSFEEFFAGLLMEINFINAPLKLVNLVDKYDIDIKVNGGGITGQLEAIRLAISKALCTINNDYRPILNQSFLLRRDSRIKERRKYGLKKARKASQYSKR
jgi:small subunit ribosomal protein S9